MSLSSIGGGSVTAFAALPTLSPAFRLSTYTGLPQYASGMEVVDFISRERLRTYRVVTDSDKKAIALHNHTLQLGSSLMSMIALIELSLRNSTNQRLSEDFGDHEWLLPGRAALPLQPDLARMISKATSDARKAAYSKLSYRQKNSLDARAFPQGVPSNFSHSRIVKKRQELLDVTHGQILAQTTLGFWKRLYSSDYEVTLWKPSLKRVFPDKALKRSAISKNIETIYATRNRVAHHEPVYGDRLDDAMAAIAFIRNALGCRHCGDESSFRRFSTVHHLRLRMDYESFVDAWHTLT